MARAAIESMLAAADFAADRGVVVQTLVIADRATEGTIEIVNLYQSRLRIEHVNVGDPGVARNFGAEIADSEYVSFFDGDDAAGETWLFNAYLVARKNPLNIVHPHIAIHFGDPKTQHICEFVPMTDKFVRRNFFIYANLFPVVHMCKKSTCLAVPYRKSDLQAGFGYEDWTWNRDTVGAGYQHVIARDTIYFARRKLSGSVSRDSVLRKCLALPSPRFFDWPKANSALERDSQRASF
jgi:glycosyltransferase involved in cell wall biosynthesis